MIVWIHVYLAVFYLCFHLIRSLLNLQKLGKVSFQLNFLRFFPNCSKYWFFLFCYALVNLWVHWSNGQNHYLKPFKTVSQNFYLIMHFPPIVLILGSSHFFLKITILCPKRDFETFWFLRRDLAIWMIFFWTHADFLHLRYCQKWWGYGCRQPQEWILQKVGPQNFDQYQFCFGFGTPKSLSW